MAGWSFAARAAGLWREEGPAPHQTDPEWEKKSLEPLIAKGNTVKTTPLRSEAGRDLRGVLLAPPLVDRHVLERRPCVVVYCPSESTGGASCEEALPIAGMLLPLRIYVLALDISGSHMYCDASDVECAVRYLRDLDTRAAQEWPVPGPNAKEDDQMPLIALWGRSAGANAALNYAASDPLTISLLCDGAYSDLPSLLGLPSWMAAPFSGLKKLAEDVADVGSCHRGPPLMSGGPNLEPEAAPSGSPPWEIASRLWMPAMYVNGELDRKVPPSCARALRDAHAGESQLLLVKDATHESLRPEGTLAQMAIFAHRSMQRTGPLASSLAPQVEHLQALALGKPPLSPRADSNKDKPKATQQGAGLDIAASAAVAPLAGHDLRRALLDAALAASPGLRGLTFREPITAPAIAAAFARGTSVPMRHRALATFLSPDAEVTIAWAQAKASTYIADAAGVVRFVTLSAARGGEVRLVEVMLSPRSGALQAHAQELTSRSLSSPLHVGAGAKPQPVVLSVGAAGEVELQVGRLSIRAPAPVLPGGSNSVTMLVRARRAERSRFGDVDAAAAAGQLEPEVTLWLAATRGGAWSAAGGEEEAQAHLAGIACDAAEPLGYEATATATARSSKAAQVAAAPMPAAVPSCAGTVASSAAFVGLPPRSVSGGLGLSALSPSSAAGGGVGVRCERLPMGSLSMSCVSSVNSPLHSEVSQMSPFRLTPAARFGAGAPPPSFGSPLAAPPRSLPGRRGIPAAPSAPPAGGEEAAFRTTGSSESSLGSSAGLAPAAPSASTWPGRKEKPFERPTTWQAGDAEL